jgi:hypothetical protein
VIQPHAGNARLFKETPSVPKIALRFVRQLRIVNMGGNLLEAIRKGEALGFEEWVGSFLENYSSPPIRAAKTHEANLRCATHLKAAFPGRKRVDITADAIEDYLRSRLVNEFA